MQGTKHERHRKYQFWFNTAPWLNFAGCLHIFARAETYLRHAWRVLELTGSEAESEFFIVDTELFKGFVLYDLLLA